MLSESPLFYYLWTKRVFLVLTPKIKTISCFNFTHRSICRSKVVTQWYEEGGMLLVGYEMYRLLASRKSRKRRTKKNKGDGQTVIDLDERDRISNLQTG